MNIFEAMENFDPTKQEQDSETKSQATDAANFAQQGEGGGLGLGFYNAQGGAPEPLFKGYTGPGAKIPDIDHDGIPDHMDYHFGPGQF